MRFSRLIALTLLLTTPASAQLAQTGAGSSSAGDPFPSFLLYDNFTGTPALVNGRVPPKGSAWQGSGAAAGNLFAGNGRLYQDANIVAGYAFNNLGTIPGTVTAKWNNTTGTVDFAPTLCICSANSGSSPFLHGEGGTTTFLIRLGTASGTFIMPGWSLWSPAYTLSSGVNYTTSLHYSGSWASMVLTDGDGNVVGQQMSYDPDMTSYVGNWIFAETFDTKMGYTSVSAEIPVNYVFPAINILKQTSFPTSADGFVANPFGGSVSWDANGVLITGTVYASGGSIPIGSVLTGDRIYVSYDVTAQTGGTIISVIPTGVAGAPVAEIYNVAPGTTGRIQTTNIFTITADTPDASFLIGNDGVNGNTSTTVRSLLVIKNPPTTF